MNTQQRASCIEKLNNAQFDVVVIGAGINGASVFRDLAINGVSVLLLDKQDFCAGASAAPSRLIHGGIKYLENGEFRLVAESTHERNRLLLNAGHLVKPLPCTIPFDSWFGGLFSSAFKFLRLPGGRFKKRGVVVVKLGLMIYDWMGRKQRVMPTHEVIGSSESRKKFSGLAPSVVATGTYFDALITQPERLCVELITDTLADTEELDNECCALNYASVISADANQLCVRDEIQGDEFKVGATIVVNAAGPWIDKVNNVLGIDSRYIGGSKGSHLILNHPEMQASLNGHMLYFETGDNRLCLAYSIGDRVLVGTTDIRVDDPDTSKCEEEEIDYLIKVMGELLPDIPFDRQHIVYRYSGVRPLPFSDGVGVGKVSRDHSIETDEPTDTRAFTVMSLVGGKWTTFRAFGEVSANQVFSRLDRVRERNTVDLAIGGGREYPNNENRSATIKSLSEQYQLSEGVVGQVMDRYGCKHGLLSALSANEDGAKPLQSVPDYDRAEVVFACQHEKVAHLEDFFYRRSTLALEGRASANVVDEVAAIAAEELGWDAKRLHDEVDRCNARLDSDGRRSS
ncbi:MAG: FAD-dependent oxidoreductase [Granulosicoccus sp.]